MVHGMLISRDCNTGNKLYCDQGNHDYFRLDILGGQSTKMNQDGVVGYVVKKSHPGKSGVTMTLIKSILRYKR